jgi:CheY-like chemotaxis protein
MSGADQYERNEVQGCILIVDDDPDTCLLLETLLRGKGYATEIAYSGEEAVKRVKNEDPDLVVLDLMMPRMDGWEVLTQVREVSEIPVIILTALQVGEQEARASRLRVNGLMQKPFYPSDLIEKIESLVQRHGENGSTPGKELAPRRTRRRVSVSVVIPTLNEAENLALILPYLPMEGIHEVILVDGHSDDGTVEAAKRLMPSIKIVREKTLGKGAALRAGYRAASGDIIVGMDADGSHDPREIPRIVRALLEGADFVKCSRFAPQGGTTDMPRYRKLGNAAFVHLSNLLFGCTFTDITYGYHAFWRSCLDVIEHEDINGFDFEPAIYLRAVRQHLRIVEVPSFEGYRFTGMGKLKTLPDGWRILTRILHEWIDGLTAPSPHRTIGFRSDQLTHIWVPGSPMAAESPGGWRSNGSGNLRIVKMANGSGSPDFRRTPHLAAGKRDGPNWPRRSKEERVL